MRTKALLILALLMFEATATGCATYGAKGVMPNLGDVSSVDKARLFANAGGDIIVTVYPLTTKEETEKYFDEDLLEKGILAVATEVRCDKPVTMVAATLTSEGAKPVAPMASDDIYAVMKRGWGARSVFWWFFGLYVGAPISAYATNKTNENIQQDLGDGGKLLNFGKTQKGVATGFLCFRTSTAPATAKGKLTLIFQKEGQEGLTECNLDIGR